MSSSSKKERNKPKFLNFLFNLGLFISTISILVVITTLAPVIKEEVKYDLTTKKTSTEIKPVNRDFAIVIPKINANSPIIIGVDPKNPSEYQEALSRGVAHAKGTALPGQTGNVFLFSHSSVDFYQATRYNSVFYLLNKLEAGDQIIIYYQKEMFTYLVDKKIIVDPADTSYLTRKSNEKELTLMTCWPPGTSLKRLIIETHIGSSSK